MFKDNARPVPIVVWLVVWIICVVAFFGADVILAPLGETAVAFFILALIMFSVAFILVWTATRIFYGVGHNIFTSRFFRGEQTIIYFCCLFGVVGVSLTDGVSMLSVFFGVGVGIFGSIVFIFIIYGLYCTSEARGLKMEERFQKEQSYYYTVVPAFSDE